MWGYRTSDIPSSFVFRPMPRPIITYEEDRGDHGNPKNRAEDNFILGQPRPRQKKSDLLTSAISQSLPKRERSTAGKHMGAQRQSNSRKSYCLPIKCSTINTLAALMWKRPLNSVALATPTHRRPDGISDGTNTQVVA